MRLSGWFVFAGLICQLAAATPKQPKFSARRDYLGINGGQVLAGDVNKDGFGDIVLVSDIGVETFFGTASGNLKGVNEGPLGMEGQAGAALADMNGDGIADLIVAGNLNQTGPPSGIGVRLGNGDGTFQTLAFYAAGSDVYVQRFAIGDFNGDQIPDVITAGESGVWLFLGQGNGTLQNGTLTVPLAAKTGRPVAADFNGDGKLDVVVTLPLSAGGQPAGFVLLFGNGDGTFRPAINFTNPIDPFAIVTADFNRDGHADIAMTAADSSYLYVFLGNGAGGFENPKLLGLPSGEALAVGDVNGDGILDIVTPGVYIAFGKGDGTFNKPAYYPIELANYAVSVALSSIRGNGQLDVVTSVQLSLSVLLNQGKGKFLEGNWTPVSGAYGCGIGGDFNGDGKPDLAMNTTQGISILLGTGKTNSLFTVGASFPLTTAGCPQAGDLNGDGVLDLVVPTATSVDAYLGNGDGTFRQSASIATNPGGYITLGDFNHDGKLDFATCGDLLFLGNGDGTFGTSRPIGPPAPGGYFSSVTAGDLNGDGWSDIVATYAFNDYVYVFVNNQQGGFTGTVMTDRLESPFEAILTDLNGDGYLDALIPSLSFSAQVYLGDGTGTLTAGQKLIDPVNLQNPAIVADVNGDGIPDIVLLEGSTAGVYLGLGGGMFSTSPIGWGGGPGPGSIFALNLHGQSPSAGIPDIVLPDGTGGVMVLVNTTK